MALLRPCTVKVWVAWNVYSASSHLISCRPSFPHCHTSTHARRDAPLIPPSQIKVMPPELTGAKSARAAETVRPKTFFVLQALKAVLPQVIVQGIPSVNRAVINVQEAAAAPAASTGSSAGGGAEAPKERQVVAGMDRSVACFFLIGRFFARAVFRLKRLATGGAIARWTFFGWLFSAGCCSFLSSNTSGAWK